MANRLIFAIAAPAVILAGCVLWVWYFALCGDCGGGQMRENATRVLDAGQRAAPR